MLIVKMTVDKYADSYYKIFALRTNVQGCFMKDFQKHKKIRFYRGLCMLYKTCVTLDFLCL